jgi:hypothetical protein
MSDVAKKKPEDMFGRVIELGDLCVYPVRRGSQMWMNRITVNSISHDAAGEPRLAGQKQDGYPVRVTSLERVAIIGRNNIIPFAGGADDADV